MNRAMRNLMLLTLHGLATGLTTIEVDKHEIATRVEKKSLLPKESGTHTDEAGTDQEEATTRLEGQNEVC